MIQFRLKFVASLDNFIKQLGGSFSSQESPRFHFCSISSNVADVTFFFSLYLSLWEEANWLWCFWIFYTWSTLIPMSFDHFLLLLLHLQFFFFLKKRLNFFIGITICSSLISSSLFAVKLNAMAFIFCLSSHLTSSHEQSKKNQTNDKY